MSSQSLARPPMENQSSTAITRASAPDVIRTPDQYAQSVQRWQREHAHVLSPVAQFTAGLPAHLGLVAAHVYLDPNPTAGDVYRDPLFCGETEVALAKSGLMKIAQAAGMSIKTTRTDDRRQRHYWEFKATIRFIGIDGTPQEIEATSEYDLRDGAPRLEKMAAAAQRRGRSDGGGAQILAARLHGLRNAEQRSIHAAIRMLGIRQKYQQTEIGKPFIAVRVLLQPDMSDAETRRQVTERMLAGTSTLYDGPATRQLAAPLEEDDAIDVEPVRDEPTRSAPAAEGRLIVKVVPDPEAGLTEITLDGGEIVVTHDSAVAEQATKLNATNARVKLTMGERDGQPIVTGIAEAATAPHTHAVPDGAIKLAKVDTFTGKSRSTGRPFTRYTIIAADGEKWSTFSDTDAKEAQTAIDKGWYVRIADKINPNYPDQRDIQSLTLLDPSQPNLPGTDDGGRY